MFRDEEVDLVAGDLFKVPDTSATRHFGTGSRKSRDTSDPMRFGRDTAPPVIRLKLGAEMSGHFGTNFVVPIEVSCGRSVRLPYLQLTEFCDRSTFCCM